MTSFPGRTHFLVVEAEQEEEDEEEETRNLYAVLPCIPTPFAPSTEQEWNHCGLIVD